MTLTKDGWFDWMVPYALDLRVYPEGRRIGTVDNRMEFLTCHSLEANYTGLRQHVRELMGGWKSLKQADREIVIAALDRLYFPWRDANRFPTGWHWTAFTGVPYAAVQHAPIRFRLAHGNSANPHAPGGESEGQGPGQPLDAAQVLTWQRILHDIKEATGKTYTRANGGLQQHGEWGPTTCPGGRYAPLFGNEEWNPEEDEEMADPEAREAIVNLVAWLRGAPVPDPVPAFEWAAEEARKQGRVAEGKGLADRLSEVERGGPIGIGNGARVTITGIIEEETK